MIVAFSSCWYAVCYVVVRVVRACDDPISDVRGSRWIGDDSVSLETQ